eukprot:Awhi_evm1s935
MIIHPPPNFDLSTQVTSKDNILIDSPPATNTTTMILSRNLHLQPKNYYNNYYSNYNGKPERRRVLSFVPNTFCIGLNNNSSKNKNIRLKHLTYDALSNKIFFHVAINNEHEENKNVFIRFTMDKWTSHSDCSAEYVQTDSQNPAWKIYLCRIQMPTSAVCSDTSLLNIEFSLCSQTLSCEGSLLNEEWENNNEKNFKCCLKDERIYG